MVAQSKRWSFQFGNPQRMKSIKKSTPPKDRQSGPMKIDILRGRKKFWVTFPSDPVVIAELLENHPEVRPLVMEMLGAY